MEKTAHGQRGEPLIIVRRQAVMIILEQTRLIVKLILQEDLASGEASVIVLDEQIVGALPAIQHA